MKTPGLNLRVILFRNRTRKAAGNEIKSLPQARIDFAEVTVREPVENFQVMQNKTESKPFLAFIYSFFEDNIKPFLRRVATNIYGKAFLETLFVLFFVLDINVLMGIFVDDTLPAEGNTLFSYLANVPMHLFGFGVAYLVTLFTEVKGINIEKPQDLEKSLYKWGCAIVLLYTNAIMFQMATGRGILEVWQSSIFFVASLGALLSVWGTNLYSGHFKKIEKVKGKLNSRQKRQKLLFRGLIVFLLLNTNVWMETITFPPPEPEQMGLLDFNWVESTFLPYFSSFKRTFDVGSWGVGLIGSLIFILSQYQVIDIWAAKNQPDRAA